MNFNFRIRDWILIFICKPIHRTTNKSKNWKVEYICNSGTASIRLNKILKLKYEAK